MIFNELEVWFDPVPRAGPEAMAMDEWLLENCEMPLLRIYDWDGDWGSLGYFAKLAEARASMEGVSWVRRPTGGGVVDHRGDWTYSLVVPRGCVLAEMRGRESYRLVHEILMAVLKSEGGVPELSDGGDKPGGLCFENPVPFDLVDGNGRKLAGAAQRRGKKGLLHQGSVTPGSERRLRGEVFAEMLAESWSENEILVDETRVMQLVVERYGSQVWLERC
ncbi:MAG: lipoate--protein ligase family protein [Armatimonadetes bacterium]|nr:lipoate--protein ligase family protein [Akkermansiaceae bacterium]